MVESNQALLGVKQGDYCAHIINETAGLSIEIKVKAVTHKELF